MISKEPLRVLSADDRKGLKRFLHRVVNDAFKAQSLTKNELVAELQNRLSVKSGIQSFVNNTLDGKFYATKDGKFDQRYVQLARILQIPDRAKFYDSIRMYLGLLVSETPAESPEVSTVTRDTRSKFASRRFAMIWAHPDFRSLDSNVQDLIIAITSGRSDEEEVLGIATGISGRLYEAGQLFKALQEPSKAED